jgi:protein-glutamine gamma-glutamyltransferase
LRLIQANNTKKVFCWNWHYLMEKECNQMHEKFLLSRHLCIGLFAVYASVVLLHLSQLPQWMWFVCALVLIGCINIVRQKWQAPKSLVKGIMISIIALLLFLEYRQWFAIEPMLTLLLMALTLKLLEIRHQRDVFLILFLAYFVIACSFLFNQSVIHTVLAVLATIMTTAVLLQVNSLQSTVSSLLAMAIKMLLQSTLLAAVMLLVLPRISPLWSVPLQSGEAVTGISDSMSPGDFDQLIRSDKLALRIRFDDEVISRENMYWRGLVFDVFDGRRWQRSIPVKQSVIVAGVGTPFLSTAKDSTASAIAYEVLMEPTNHHWLYGVPVVTITENALSVIYTPQQEVLQKQVVSQRSKYRAVSYLQAPISQAGLSTTAYRQYTHLPRGYNPQTQKIAQQWRQQAGSHQAYINKVLEYYRGSFTYTLSPPKLAKHTVDEFLFSTRQGFCEHFSSSFAVLMRSVGIPARVVVGYQGGEWDKDNSFLQVYQRDAHAWNEVWLDGQGWLRIDPTASVADIRIAEGVSAALPQYERKLVGGSATVYPWLNQLRQQWQRMDYQWQRWVLDYDSTTQQSLLKRMMGDITATKMALAIFLPLVLVVLLISMSLFKETFKGMDKKKKSYLLLQKQMRRFGVAPEAGESIAHYCERAARAMPQARESITRISSDLDSLFYQREGQDKSQEALVCQRIKKAIKEIM